MTNMPFKAWCQDQLDLAEHMFNKSLFSYQELDPNRAEALADIYFQMGKDTLGKGQCEMAAKWLNRAYDVLSGQSLDRMSFDTSELRTSIVQMLVKALLGMQDGESFDKAQSLIGLLEGEIGDNLIVLHLRLELLSTATYELFDAESFSNILRRMIRDTAATDANLKLIMFHIRKLSNRSPNLACRAVDYLLKLLISKGGRVEWLEKVLITRLWMAEKQKDTMEDLVSLEDILSKVITSTNQPIDSSATHAAQIVSSNASRGSLHTHSQSAAVETNRVQLHARPV